MGHMGFLGRGDGEELAHSLERVCPHLESGRGGASNKGPKMASEFG